MATQQRARPGEIRDAIVESLTTAKGDQTVAEIHSAVSSSLGREIPPSSVRSYLRLNSPARFERTGRGRYRLRRR